MKRSLFKTMLIALSLGFLSSCSGGDGYKTINSKEAYKMMQEEKVIILDVRTVEEFQEGHIEGAINIPLDEIRTRSNELNKEDTILVYCRSGNRSKTASNELVKLGFSHVFDFGGVNNWSYGLVK
ncbi:rhodanese-like domain-containing protein [Anaerorhabdus furcosa]|uniref:Rhodanese-related sulfurtransferase n=1 Tax=Anaerorhabdus furcosa TaxID=118967 RepID=A0A1T4NMP3_9FIRM|nr:rhodanese-like domain-containing protein [Anaerorhabdus furcosa]SJZ80433.1 Rhodanese-related sulfurtransferase [Anaerorhabdus furcosa]